LEAMNNNKTITFNKLFQLEPFKTLKFIERTKIL
jgi:hypothetical protein